MSGQHARLSASSAHRWMRCPGSIQAAEGKPDGTSIHAATGTVAHTIASHSLDSGADPVHNLGVVYEQEGHEITVDQEMVDVIKVYLDFIAQDAKVGDINKAEMPLLEPLQKIHPDLGGTADYVRYRPSTGELLVVDFKFGSGMFVEVEDNEQAMLYALGVALGLGAPISSVEVVIVQPRYEGAAPIRRWVFPLMQVIDFMADVKAAALATKEPNPKLAAGDWCKFCKAARTCPELEAKQHSLVALEFGAITDYAKVASALASIPLVKERIKALEEFAYKEAVAGRFGEAHGFKLVDKRPMRKWADDAKAMRWCAEHVKEGYVERKLKSPPQIEALLPKDMHDQLAELVVKESSGWTLVPASDKRPPAKRITAEDFNVVESSATAVQPAKKGKV
jgi:hypothetical protein